MKRITKRMMSSGYRKMWLNYNTNRCYGKYLLPPSDIPKPIEPEIHTDEMERLRRVRELLKDSLIK